MKSRPISTPAARPPLEQTPDAGQPRPRSEQGEAAAPFDPSNEPGPLTVPQTDKLFAHVEELLAIGGKLTRTNDALRITLERIGAWLIANAPLLSAAGADIAGLTSILAESLAAAKAAKEAQDRE